MSYEDHLVHKRYLVTGRRRYRWHEPGTIFEAKLDPGAERRAIQRGSIEVLEIVKDPLEQGAYELPEDWPPAAADNPKSQSRRRRLVSSE